MAAEEEKKGLAVEVSGYTKEIEILKEAVTKAIHYGFAQEVTGGRSPFPLRTITQVAKIFNVSHHTVRGWTRRGLLRGRYQVLSGRNWRLVFSNCELERFFDENFPSPEDIGDHPCSPRKGSKAARLVEKMFRMNRLYARRRQPRERDERE